MTTKPERWIFKQFDKIDPAERRLYSLRLLVASTILWPITALTIFRDEQQGILGLSFFAIIITCVDIIATTDVRKEVDES